MPAQPQRTLGQGLTAGATGLGCMSITSGFYGPDSLSEEDAIQLIRQAYDLGVTLFNTSDLYGPYTNEVLLGKALKGIRDKVVITTKWGPMFEPGTHNVIHNQSRAYAREACEGALKRLDTDTIDLFTLRGPVQPGVDIADVMEEIKLLVSEGKIKYVGLSEVGPKHIRAAHAVVPITAIEQEWSLFAREIETDLLPTCHELGIGVLAYSPLGRGLLTGQLKDISQLHPQDFRIKGAPQFEAGNLKHNLELVSKVEALATKKGCSPAQLALAWLLAQGPDVIPIPGTKRISAIEDNVGGATVQLTPEEVQELSEAVPVGAVKGDRYAHADKLTYLANMKE